MKEKIGFLFLAVILSFSACSDNEPALPGKGGGDEDTDNVYINKWIYTQMKDNYYWTDQLLDISSLDTSKNPDAFFTSMLYQYLVTDRFSYIERTQSKSTKSTTANEIGFEYTGLRFVDQNGNATGDYGLAINYVKPNTDAQTQGLQRGQVVRKVDDAKITQDNWYSVLSSNKESYKLELLNIVDGKQSVLEKTIAVSHNYRENPVYLDSIYSVGSHKIGYLVFNSFGTSADSDNDEDNLKLINTLSKFSDANITDLVLDLRYNGGGLVTTAVYLASALVPNRNTSQIFEIKEFNAKNQVIFANSLNDYFVDNMSNTQKTAIPKLGDKINLYILTGKYTASASELTINGLNPWIKDSGKKITLIGETTYGKNYGSFAITNDTDERLKQWTLHPISFKTFNRDKESNYKLGFNPDIAVNDFKSLTQGLKPLGDVSEDLLSTAISKIIGESSTQKAITVSNNEILGTSLEKRVTPLIIEPLQ